MSALRVGIIGFGYTGRLHLAAWQATEGVEVASVAETRVEAKNVCPPNVRWHRDYQDLLANDIDAVSVCLPTSLHADVVQQALAQGKHVLVEKPIATNLEDADAMIGAASRFGKKLFVGMTHRFYPEVIAAKRLVDDGAIGEIVMIRDCIFEHFGFLDSPGWYFDRDIAGGGVVLSSGIHLVDRVMWFAGEEAATVAGTTSNGFFRKGVEDAAQMSLSFRSGCSAQISFGFLAQPHPLLCDLELIGTKGSIVVHTWQGYEVRLPGGVKVHDIYQSEPHAAKVLVGLKAEFEAFASAIRESREPQPSVEESTRALRVIMAFYQAAQLGKTLSLGSFMKYILALFLLAYPAAAGQLVLMDRQQARYIITSSPSASEPEKFAADELRRYLELIGGGSFASSASGAPKIHVGDQSAEVKALLEGRAEDSFVVVTSGKNLFLAGNTPRATLYAVYYLLEKYLECGWLQPGDDAVPRRATVALPDFIRDIEEPRFSHRSVNLYPYVPVRAIPRIDWAAKNRLNWVHVCTNSSNHWEAFDSRKTFIPELRKRGLHLNYGGHTFNTWVSPKVYFEKHPEYFSMIGGKRNPAQLNIANAEVARVAAEAMNKFLDENPEVEMIDIWLNDTTKFDDSADVKKMEGEERTSIYGTLSKSDLKTRTNANIRFVNAVAGQVAKKHPTVLVQSLAYFQLIDAPTVKPASNVMVGFAPISRMPGRFSEEVNGYWYPLVQPGHPVNNLHLQEIQKWLKVISSDRFFTYEYYSHVTTSKGMVNMNTSTDDLLNKLIEPSKKGFHVYTSAIASDIQLYSQIGMKGVGSEDWDWDELNMYTYAHLLWHPELSSDAIIADYCHRSYGAASEEMLRHWLVLQDARDKFRGFKAQALEHLQAAKKMEVSPAERRRIDTVEETWAHIQ